MVRRFSRKISKKRAERILKISKKKLKTKKTRKTKRYFGEEYGPGYQSKSQSYPNGWVPYFGSRLDFIQPSSWALPISDSKVQLQSMYTY